ncbi:MAG: LysR family transcriptional regulator [Planctomycetota bacterium]
MTFSVRGTDALTIQQMRTFCEVIRCGGYAAAAESLGMSAPTIWEQVKAVESIYQAKLFARSGRNVTPTAAGHALSDFLQPVLAEVESTFDRLAEQQGQPSTQITLVTGARMMMEELGSPLRQFRRKHPSISLRIKTADNITAQQIVLRGEADLALLIQPPEELRAAGIDCRTLYPLEVLAALPPRHRLIRQSSIKLVDLIDDDVIVGSPETVGRRLLEQARFRLGMTQPLKIAAETDNSAITIACVRAGLGVGIIAGRADGTLTRHIQTRSITDEVGQVNVVAAYRKGRRFTQVIDDLVNQLTALG